VVRRIAVVVACVAVAGALFALGRESADSDGAPAEDRAAAERAGHAVGLREGLVAGHASGVAEGRAVGIRAGHDAGLQEGRALQLSEALPRADRAAARRAFHAGYVAGANDAFGGFDGGWAFAKPYVITLRRGKGAITYRVDTRRPARGKGAP
jgi:hypothetical protein